MENEKYTEEIMEEILEQTEPDEQTKAQKKASFILITGIIVLAIIMAFATFYGVRKYMADQEAAAEIVAAHHTNAHGYPSWSVHMRTNGTNSIQYYYLNKEGQEIVVTADEVNSMLNTQVVTCGDMSIDNRILQYYYSDSLFQFSNYYSDYLMYLLDSSAPYDSQMNSSTGDGSTTWQRTFMDMAIDQYHSAAAIVQEAEASGMTLTEEDQAYIAEMTDVEMLAMAYGYPDGNTLVKAMIGPMATAESYKQYMTDTTKANLYLEKMSENMEVTEEEISAYYDENADTFAAQGITQDDTPVVNVRHILIRPEAAEDGTITDAAWAAAEQEANRILNEWKSGEATEESFGVLATTYTADTGSQSTGGLYEDVYPGQMVPTFNDWCFDETRQSGDTGVVKADYGYHIMYYVSQGDYAYWHKACEEAVMTTKLQKMNEDMMAKFELKADFGKMIILDAAQATVPQPEGQNVVVTDTAQ